MKKGREILITNLYLPVADLFRGTHVKKAYTFLQKSQWWSKKEIEEYQNDKLLALLKHAYANVPYYNKLFNELGIKPQNMSGRKDLKKIPVLTKEKIRSAGLKNMTAGGMKKNLILSASSGSTGEPLRFYIDKQTKSWALAAQYRGWNWAGYRFGDKVFSVWGNRIFYEKAQKFFKRFIDNKIKNVYFFPSFMLRSEESFYNLINNLEKINPDFLYGYSYALYLTARFIETHNISLNLKLKAIITTAETLSDYQRKLIEKIFKAPSFDQYGCGEIMSIAYQCEDRSGYHIVDEHVIVEFNIIGETDGGELAELIITDLDNWGMPFIRYKVGDLAIPSNKSCHCGRHNTMLKKIIGRQNDLIRTPEGGFLTVPSFFGSSAVKNKITGVLQFQIIQESIDEITVKLVVDKNTYTIEDEKKLKKFISDYVGPFMKFRIVYCDSIEATNSGKFKWVISKLST